MRSIAATFLSLACACAHGQMHKCVDERGKLSYQEQPCAGTRSLPPPRPASSQPAVAPSPANVRPTVTVRPTATPAPVAQPSAAPSAASAPGAPATQDAAARYCADNWPPLKRRIAVIRQTAMQMRGQSSRDGIRQVEADNVAEFLRDCARFGFVAPDSEGLEPRNDVLAREIDADQAPRGR